MSGGGSFSACLERAIRQQRKSPSLINSSTGGGGLENIDEESATTTSSSAASANNNDNNNEMQNQDWSSHHVSYNILQECLTFFSRRRAAVKSAIRCNNNNGPTNNNSNNSTNNNNNNGKKKKKVLSEAQLNSILHEYAQKEAPCLNENVTEYAQQRALGKTPPRGYKDTTNTNTTNNNHNNNNRNRSNIFLRSLCISCYSEEELNEMEEDEESNEVQLPYMEFNAASSSNNHNNNLQHPTISTSTNNPSPPLNQMENTLLLTEAEIIKRLSFMERSELSAVLDSEVDRATTFYRHRLSELAPPRLDGSGGGAGGRQVVQEQHGGGIVVGNSEFKGLLHGENENDDDDNDILDIVEPSPNQKYYQGLTFNDLGSEILELHAYITTNIIVIRQILIRYDAFVRSLGGSPMSSWYQKSRRIKGKHGRTSDYADLLSHIKLKRLTQAYISEYKSNLENDTEGLLGTKGSGGSRRGKRFRGFAYQFHKLMDEMRERQRLRWRQPALDLHDSSIHNDDNDNQGGVGGSGDPAVSSNDDDDDNNVNGGGVEVIDGIPSPPLQPPDYANLRSNPDIGEDIEYQVYIFKCVQSKTQRSIEKTYSGRASGVRDNFIATLREYFLLGSALDNLSLMPEYLIMRGKSLKSSLLVVAQWRDARKANLYGIKRGPTTPDDPSGGGESSWFGGFCSEPQPKVSQSSSLMTHFGLLVNILGCFFYMMNYYIVGPSSVEYANYLGEADAMSGLIIGAMPWAALISAFMYSIWTNHSYRTPLLASGVLLIAGNVLYSSAVQGALVWPYVDVS
jgi:hypothetical protein